MIITQEGLADQLIEDGGDGDEAHGRHEDVADLTLVFRHGRNALDGVHGHEEQDGGDDALAQQDASFVLMMLTMAEFLPQLIEALGGEEVPQGV